MFFSYFICHWLVALTLTKWTKLGVQFFETLHQYEDKLSIKNTFLHWALEPLIVWPIKDGLAVQYNW